MIYPSSALRGSKILLVVILLTGAEQFVGNAYMMPPSFAGMAFSRVDYIPTLRRSPAKLRSFQQQTDVSQEYPDDPSNLQKNNPIERKSIQPYKKFKLSKFPENSPQWNMAMIKYLLDMKKNGHKIKEISTTKTLPEIHRALNEGKSRLISSNPEVQQETAINMEPQGVESGEDVTSQGPIICKMEPFNACYRVDERGVMHPLGDRRPVRLLRVYKKK